MKKSRLAEIKQKCGQWAPEKKAEIVANIRAKHLDRWMERMAEIGRPVTDPEEIDYTDQQIHIEWLLCDPRNLALIKSKKPEEKQRVYDQLTPEEWECYNTPTSDGWSYKRMEEGGLNREMAKALMHLKRGDA